ncbi:MAG: hemerythrin domain-containing protein [Rikenellaceae bacterium]
MYRLGKYIPSDSMSDLICQNYPMLLVMGRFGIDLGFGEQSIGQTCKSNGVDTYTFLSVVNLLISGESHDVKIDHEKVSLSSLVTYLHNSHSYFLEYRLPTIRRELIEALGSGDVSKLILNYYDEYVAEVNKHMMYEEETLFPYIGAMIAGECTSQYNIDVYSKHHDKVETKLSELKNIVIKYYPSSTTHELTNVLYDIFSCERDLASHNSIEDYLLVPTMKVLESKK